MLVARERLEMGRIEEINDRILDLQDITFQEQIPESERGEALYVGVHWYTEEEIARAKAEIAELEQELLKLEAQEATGF